MEEPERDRLRELGRIAFKRNGWGEAYEAFKTLDQAAALEPEDLELLSTASYMLGFVDEMLDGFERAHFKYLERGEVVAAVKTALWLASNYSSRSKTAHASGWLERGKRLLNTVDTQGAARGYMLLPSMLRFQHEGEHDKVIAVASQAAEIGRRHGDPDLVALAAHVEARAMLRQGLTDEGMRLLDEVMISAERGDLSPVVTGIVYCTVVDCCYESHEIRRAAEWTAALSEWCDSQPDLVAFTDQCLAHRSGIMRLQGKWQDAEIEARRALGTSKRTEVAAQAAYQQAEICRCRGETKLAEDAYSIVAAKGGNPLPGLALLWLAEDRTDAAAASIRRALREPGGHLTRARLLPAAVEILIASGDTDEAREAAEEMDDISSRTGVEMHRAWAAQSLATVLLAESRPDQAILSLRQAAASWQSLGVPYDLASVRVALGEALAALGDHESASLEWIAAAATFSELGATPDVERVNALRGGSKSRLHGLTARELEVLRLLASGSTNRSIADELVLSPRTVDRHVSNIFTKLGVSTRAAATASAIRNKLV